MLNTNFVSMKEILKIAEERKIALGAFEFWSYESARAIVEAGEETGIPVILQCGQMEIDRMGGVENTVSTAYMAAKSSSVPIALHLDHAVTFELCNACINAGFSSVMIDASALPFERNIELTRRVVDRARALQVSVEGELGRLVGEEGTIAVNGPEAAQTDPNEALEYVKKTGIDALAVSIGTAHGQYTFEPKLNIQRLKSIKENVEVPIVLHGGSGTPINQVQEAIRCGIRKINICTDIQIAMGRAFIKVQKEKGFRYSAKNLWDPAEAAAKAVIKDKIQKFALLD